MANVVTSQNIDSFLKSADNATARTNLEVAKVNTADMHDFLSSANYSEARLKLGVSGAESVVGNIATNLKATTPTSATVSIEALGYHIKGDGGGGVFYWDATSTQADNAGTIIAPTNYATGRWIRVIEEVGETNVRWFGATGDGSTNDTTSVMAAFTNSPRDYTLFFPQGTYRVNLLIDGNDNADNWSKLKWVGVENKTTLESFDTTFGATTVKFTEMQLRVEFKNLHFRGTGNGATIAKNNGGITFDGDAIHYSNFTNCAFSDAKIGLLLRSFGTTFRTCRFGKRGYGSSNTSENTCLYGFVGIGNVDSYAGWNRFEDCIFQGSKCAYYSDDDDARGLGQGSVHIKSDWEAVTGLPIFIRGKEVRPEVFDTCWLEGNSGTGNTVNMDDLPLPATAEAVGDLVIPSSGIILQQRKLAGSVNLKPCRVEFKGTCAGFSYKGKVIADIDQLRTGSQIVEMAAGPYPFADIRVKRYAGFNGASTDAIVERLEEYQSLNGASGSAADPITGFTHEANIRNYAVAAQPDWGDRGLYALGGASATLNKNDGAFLGWCYDISLPPESSITLAGQGYTERPDFRRLNGFSEVCAGTFSLKDTSGGVNAQTVKFSWKQLGTFPPTPTTDPDDILNLKTTSEWTTYKVITGSQGTVGMFYNPSTTATISFRVADIQFLNTENISMTKMFNIINSGVYCTNMAEPNYRVASLKVPVAGDPDVYTIGGKLKTLNEKQAELDKWHDRIYSGKHPTTGLPFGTELKISATTLNGGFENWNGSAFTNWTSSGSVTLSQSSDSQLGSGSLQITTGGVWEETAGTGGALMSTGTNLTGNNIKILVGAWVKKVSGAGSLYVATGNTFDADEIIAFDEARYDSWTWVIRHLKTAGSTHSSFGFSTSGDSVWRVDGLRVINTFVGG